MAYKIKLEPAAFADIQQAIEYYNEQRAGLGKRFHQTIKKSLEALKIKPFYQIRYDNVHCFYTRPFPFLIHFKIDDTNKIIHVLAIIHTSMDPQKWPKKEQ